MYTANRFDFSYSIHWYWALLFLLSFRKYHQDSR